MPGVISQGTTNTSSQSLPQFQTGQPQEINWSGVLVKDENLQQQQHDNNASREGNDVTLQSQGDRQQREGEQNSLLVPQANGAQIPGKTRFTKHEPDRPYNPDSECESQYLKLQKMSNQQATVAEQASNPPNCSKQVPFGLLLPVLMNQLDKNKGMQLQELFGKPKVSINCNFFHQMLFL